MSNVGTRKTFVLGMDGATWSILDPLLARGRMPNLAALVARGTRATLLSTTHPVSPIAWSSIATGKNAGKHGIFDFARRTPGSYRLEAVSSRLQHGPTLWDLTSAAGLRTGVFNVPVTYPPRDVNGFMVTCLFTPSNKVCFTHPADLSAELNRLTDGYEFSTREVFNPGHERAYVDSILRTLDKRRAALDFLLDRHTLDCGMLVYTESDHVQHKLFPPDNLLGGELPWPYSGVTEVYERLDAAVGRLIERLGPEANYLLISDHGAGEMRGVMYINRWLMDEGFLRLKRSLGYPLKWFLARTNLLTHGYRALQMLGLGRLADLVPNNLREAVATSFVSFDDVDWTRTRAYSFGEFGQIFLNLKGREPQGVVEPGAEADRTLADLARGLRKVIDPATGRPVVTRIWRGGEVFHGPAAGEGPDLLFAIDDYARDASVQFGLGRQTALGQPEFMDRGCHRPEGVLIAAGPDIHAGRAEPASVMDITPTALHLLGLPVPEDMDGRVLKNILAGDAASRDVKRSTAAAPAPAPEQAAPVFNEEEQREVEKRLHDLGYLD
ncbi:MAG: alkaline phosphatase family protein [Planctomycetota bacterium]|nr:alkaline phosphatase family protein [Planctomycetota bacterium]